MTQPGGFTNGYVVTANDLNDLPGGVMGTPVRVTADQVSIGTSATDLTSLSVTFTAVAGRTYKISGHAGFINPAGGHAYLLILKGSTQIQAGGLELDSTYIHYTDPFVYDTPGGGSVTYKLQALASTGTMTMKASSTGPAVLLVEDIGTL